MAGSGGPATRRAKIRVAYDGNHPYNAQDGRSGDRRDIITSASGWESPIAIRGGSMPDENAERLRLLQEINDGLEHPSAPLSALVRKAARLAVLSEDSEHQLLFELHLDGTDPSGLTGSRIKRWSEGRPPKWDVVAAFMEDRLAAGGQSLALPLEQLERATAQLSQAEDSDGDAARHSFAINAILVRIRNRVGRFALHVQENMEKPYPRDGHPKRVFIGHGRSTSWRELKDFLQDRLGLAWDEFNREPVAGMTTKERLEGMLQIAGFAFLVLTAEDEHADKSVHARENVIHEAGLFQGRLGFMKAIVLLEEGCAEFSNIVGLSQIRFPKGNVLAKSEEIRRVLEREGLA